MFYEAFELFSTTNPLNFSDKSQVLSISTGNNIIKWDDKNVYAHSMILAQFTCKLLEKSRFDNNIVHKFINFYKNKRALFM